MLMRSSVLVLTLFALLPRPFSAQAHGDNGHGLTDDSRFQQALSLFEMWLDAKMDYEDIPAVSVAGV